MIRRLRPPAPVSQAALLGALLAFAAGIRLLGVGRGLPYIHEWDEPSIMSPLIGMLQRGDVNPSLIYPGVYNYMLFPAIYLHYWYLHLHGALSSPWEIQVAQAVEPFWYLNPASFYLWARVVTALIGVAAVWAVYRIGREVYGPAAGLLAAAFLAAAPGAVYFSDTVRVDVPMAFFVSAAVLAGLGIIRTGRWPHYLAAGLLAGLAISAKMSAVWIVVTLAAAHLASPSPRRVLDLRVAAMGLCVLAGFVIGTPSIVIRPGDLIAEAHALAIGYGGFPRLAWMRRSLPEYLAYLVRPNQAGDWTLVPHAGLGLLPIVACAVGIVAGFSGRRRLHLYLLSFPAFYFLYMSAQNLFPVRAMMPVLPFAALFAGAGCVETWRFASARWPASRTAWGRALAALALVVVLFFPWRDGIALGWTLGHEVDTRTAAVEWLQRHVASDARIAFEDDLRWRFVDLYRLPFVLGFAPRAAPPAWYLERHVDFAVVGAASPLRSLQAVAAFPRPAYLGPEAPYPIIDPALYIVRPSAPQIETGRPVVLGLGDMILQPGPSAAPGTIAETVRLPDQPFLPGDYSLAVAGEWPRELAALNYALERLQATVRVGRMTVARVTLTGSQPLRFTTPVFRVDRAQVLPVQIDLAMGVRRRAPERAWAMRPSPAGCATASDAPSLDVQHLTLEAWVRLDDLEGRIRKQSPGSEFGVPLLGKGGELGYSLGLLKDARSRVYATWSVAGRFFVERSPLLPYGRWTHVAATYDGHAARIYLNGIPADMDLRRTPPDPNSRVQAEGAPFTIGCAGRAADQLRFKGLITGVRVWDKVLSPDAVREETGVRRFSDASAGLVGSWSFQPDARGIVTDRSGAGNDLAVDHLERVQIERSPFSAQAQTRGPVNVLRTVTVGRVGYPVVVDPTDMAFDSATPSAPGIFAHVAHLPDQPFTPGLYVLTVLGDGTRPGASPSDRITADVTVGEMSVGTATVGGTQPLRLTTRPFEIRQTQTLPVRIAVTARTEQRALRPSASPCATVPDAASLNPRQLTVEAWVYLEGIDEPPGMRTRGLQAEAPILSKGKHIGYYLRLVSDASRKVDADLSVAGKFSAGVGGPVPFRKWTHVAATYDGHVAQVYLNGFPAAPVRDPRYEGTVHAESAPLVIGCRDLGGPDQAVFRGLITGVRVWDKVLPADAIRDEAERRPLPDTSLGLVGSWWFGSLVDGMVPDLSAAGNNLPAKGLRRIPVGEGALARPAWMSGSNFLRSVRIDQVTFPVTVDAADMAPGTPATGPAGVIVQTVRLPDQAFTPGSYTLRFTGEWPRQWAALHYALSRVHAVVRVGRDIVATAVLDGSQPLQFVTPRFRVGRTETLPIQVDLTLDVRQTQQPDRAWALGPPTSGCATGGDALRLDAMLYVTVEAWVFLEDVNEPLDPRVRTGEAEAPILTKGNETGYYLRLVRDASKRIYADLSVAGKFSVGRAGLVPFRKWTHVAATYDGHEARIYLNGVPAPPERDSHYDGTVRAGGAPLAIGCRDAGTMNQLVFIGLINRVRIWDRALAPETIREEAGSHPLPDTALGLAGSWSFQSLVDGRVPDLSGGGVGLAVDGALERVPAEAVLLAGPVRAAGVPPNVLRIVRIDKVSR